MSALAGLTLFALAAIGAVRVVKVTIATSRRGIARFGRFLAGLEPASVVPPSSEPEPTAREVSIEDVASMLAKRPRAKRAEA